MAYGPNISNTASCSGAITATFLWTHETAQQNDQNDPAPLQELVQEGCTTAWQSSQTSAITGYSVSGKFGNPFWVGAAPTGGFSGTETASKYSEEGGKTFSLSETITCSVTGSGAPPSSSIFTAIASVNYGASPISPITITPSGAIQDASGNWNILVGQKCTPTLNGIPLALQPYTKYAWSVSGTTFQDWEPTTPAFPNASPPTLANLHASYFLGGSGLLNIPSPLWYWNDPNNTPETISCTATVTPPTGQGSVFSIIATQKIGVVLPTVVINNAVGAGYIFSSGNETDMSAEPSAAMRNFGQEYGSTWTTSVTLPTTPAFGSGIWTYAQLITAGEYVTIGGTKLSSTDTQKGQGLDDHFPYTTHGTDGMKYNDGDTPALKNLTQPVSSAQITSSFHTYLMFQPSGNNAKWVPIEVSFWTLNFTASIPESGSWLDFPATQTVGPVSLAYNFVPQNQFPSWTQIIPTNDSFIHN